MKRSINFEVVKFSFETQINLYILFFLDIYKLT